MPTIADPKHAAEDVERWETERQITAVETSEDEQLQAKAREESNQSRADLMLYEGHVASRLRDWEAWVVLNTPNTYKRRRLQIAVHHGLPAAPVKGQEVGTTTVELPSGSNDFHVVMHMAQTEELIQSGGTNPGGGGVANSDMHNVDINSRVFDRAFEAWEGGRMSDALVQHIFGEDWLFLFGITKDGVEGDTMPPPTAPRRLQHDDDVSKGILSSQAEKSED